MDEKKNMPSTTAYPQYGASNGPTGPPPILNTHQSSFPPATKMAPSEEEPDPNDIYALTPHIEIAFEDTFTESETARGFDFMKDVNSSIYKYTHFAVYATLSLIVAPFMTFLWGFVFAVSHLFIVWFVQPAIKNTFLWFRICSMLVSASVRLFFDPCFRSASLVLSGIKGRFQMEDSEVTLNLKSSQIQNV
ncbi:caveolin-3-like [Lytechinus pictus]|uniref:caveolin-3-like n=1 Tax=Lytechinus pictus TaxID=7653 RepID=UPI00240E7E34|nr:caveolin-3-like [Lytechinus pictus]